MDPNIDKPPEAPEVRSSMASESDPVQGKSQLKSGRSQVMLEEIQFLTELREAVARRAGPWDPGDKLDMPGEQDPGTLLSSASWISA